MSKKLVLVTGDLHIPHRAAAIPPLFKQLLVPGKIQHILSTGNLCSKEVHEYLRTLSQDLHVVRGDFDEMNSFPEQKVVVIGAFKIGICHGHQLVPSGDLETQMTLQRQLDVDILITGHTHEFSLNEVDSGKKLILNPGSITGAYSSTDSTIIPSFILMDINGPTIGIFVYKLKGGEVDVTRYDFTKKE